MHSLRRVQFLSLFIKSQCFLKILRSMFTCFINHAQCIQCGYFWNWLFCFLFINLDSFERLLWSGPTKIKFMSLWNTTNFRCNFRLLLDYHLFYNLFWDLNSLNNGFWPQINNIFRNEGKLFFIVFNRKIYLFDWIVCNGIESTKIFEQESMLANCY